MKLQSLISLKKRQKVINHILMLPVDMYLIYMKRKTALYFQNFTALTLFMF